MNYDGLLTYYDSPLRNFLTPWLLVSRSIPIIEIALDFALEVPKIKHEDIR